MPKKFYRDIERLVQEIDASSSPEEILAAIMRRLVAIESATFSVESGRLYCEQAGEYLLLESIGEFGDAIAGKSVPKSYPIVKEIEAKRLVLISPSSPGFDPELEAQFSDLDYAAILVGSAPAYILSFGIRHQGSPEELMVLLQTIRATTGLKLRQNALESQLRQARTIQLSLLPRRIRQLQGFEVAAATIPAEEVGGDIYDVQRVDQGVLAVAVADASGHGLPAALQARDVVTGLRMGAARDQRISTIVRRLNRVINKSGLSSRFISLFYGEIDDTGNLIYVNCGHCPPLLINPAGEVFELPSSGPVLGPLPDAIFHRSFATVRPGEYVVIFTDGVTEHRRTRAGDSGGTGKVEEFGTENLIRVCRQNLGKTANKMVGAVSRELRAFGGGAPFADDVTLLVIHRQDAEDFQPKKSKGLVQSQSPPDARDRR